MRMVLLGLIKTPYVIIYLRIVVIIRLCSRMQAVIVLIWRFLTKARLEKVQNQRFLSKRARSYHLFNSSVLNFTKMSLISILITTVKKKLLNPTGFLHIKVKWLYAIPLKDYLLCL